MLRKIVDLLTTSERRVATKLFLLILVSAGLETLGVGLILPFLTLLVDPTQVDKITSLVGLRRRLGLETHAQMVVAAISALLAFFFMKNLFLGWVLWNKTRFLNDCYSSITDRLFHSFLARPYVFHLNQNSSVLIRTVTNDSTFYTSALGALSELGTQGLMLASVATLLFWIEPLGTTVSVVFVGAAGAIFHFASQAKLHAWGAKRQFHEGMRLRHLQEGLSGAKEIKLAGKEAHFREMHATHTMGQMSIEHRRSFLYQLPKLYFEVLAVAAMVGLIFAMLLQGKRLETFVPTLALFGAAGFRLLPSLNSCLGALHTLRYGMPSVDTLNKELHERVDDTTAPLVAGEITFRDQILLDQIGYAYPGATESVLSNVSLSITCCSTVGIIGESGAGKSTIIDLLLGLLTPATGRILVDGNDIRTDLASWQQHIGYVAQSIFLSDDTLRRNIAFGLSDTEVSEQAVKKAVQAAQLEDLISRLPEGLDTLVGERGVRLSGGERQRVGIARALYRDPTVLVLDEATSALDLDTERSVMRAVNALHGTRTIVIVAHRLTTLADCDKVFRLQKGGVANEGTYAEVIEAV